jgi:tRNA A-37 threonylcarbamoyl transferase component Bud32
VLDQRLLVTGFVQGQTMADVIKEILGGKNDLRLLREAGGQVARIHNAGASLGNIKPKNIIVVSSDNSTENQLIFTDTEQFLFSPSDQVWDIAQFISWDLKATRNSDVAGRVASEFLQGYANVARDSTNLSKLAKSRRYLESFFPLLSPSVARAIKSEVQKFAGQ